MIKKHFRGESYYPNSFKMADDIATDNCGLVSIDIGDSSSNIPPPPETSSPAVPIKIISVPATAKAPIAKFEESTITIVKDVDHQHHRIQGSKCTCRSCSFICLLCSTLVIAALVFAIVFGLHDAMISSYPSGKNSTAVVDREDAWNLNTSVGALIGLPKPNKSQEFDAKYPGLHLPIYKTGVNFSSATTAPFIPTTTTTMVPFNLRSNKIYGNLNYFMSQNEPIVISPFGIDYILSLIGNLGTGKEKDVVNSYFNNPSIHETFHYYNEIKKAFFKMGTVNYMLSNFFTGNEVNEFMIEQTTFDGVSVYHASDLSYAIYFNDMFSKNSYNKEENRPFFHYNNFTTPEQTVVGFTNLQYSLKFFRTPQHGLIKDQDFYGKRSIKVNQFVTVSYSMKFGKYMLHRIPFQNRKFDMFIVSNFLENDDASILRFDPTKIPRIDPTEILANFKLNKDKGNTLPLHPICVPEIKQQNTIDISAYFNETLKDSPLSIYTPFNAVEAPGGNKYEINKFYQALRFDLSVEGLNYRTNAKSYKSIIYSACKYTIRTPFIYGLISQDGTLIYYGALI